jgi:aspartate racemase
MTDYTKETIGIIGGCGVAAANELVCRIERRLTELGCLDDSQQPEIILYQATQAPNRIAFASGKSQISFVPYFIDVGKKLKACGATVCCIPCNTAHCSITEIESAVGIPFINIVTETLQFILQKYPTVERIGILGSSGTKISQVYQRHAGEMGHELQFLFPNGDLQDLVDRGIAAVKSGLKYISPSETRAFFSKAADDLVAQNADVIVLGCTEIPLGMDDSIYKGRPVVDTLGILTEACIRTCKSTN